MKAFGKFVTFVGITGAALAGLWYFCEVNKDKCECACDDGEASEEKKSAKERSYVSLDPEIKEEARLRRRVRILSRKPLSPLLLIWFQRLRKRPAESAS